MSAWGKSTLIKLELYAFMGLSAGRLGVPIWSTVQAKSRNGCSLKTKKIGTSIWTLKSGYRWLAAAGSSQSWRWGVAKRLTMGPQRDENTITSLFPSFCFHPPWSTSLSPSLSCFLQSLHLLIFNSPLSLSLSLFHPSTTCFISIPTREAPNR